MKVQIELTTREAIVAESALALYASADDRDDILRDEAKKALAKVREAVESYT